MQKTPHSHSHSHSHHHGGIPQAQMPAFSLLRLSVPQRLALAVIQIGFMWALLFWALMA